MDEPLVCTYCGALLAYDPAIRTPSSAWHVPGADNPTACLPQAPGHAPQDNRVYEPPRQGPDESRRSIVRN